MCCLSTRVDHGSPCSSRLAEHPGRSVFMRAPAATRQLATVRRCQTPGSPVEQSRSRAASAPPSQRLPARRIDPQTEPSPRSGPVPHGSSLILQVHSEPAGLMRPCIRSRLAASREVDYGGSCKRFLRHTAATTAVTGRARRWRNILPLRKSPKMRQFRQAGAAGGIERGAGNGICRGALSNLNASSERGVGPKLFG